MSHHFQCMEHWSPVQCAAYKLLHFKNEYGIAGGEDLGPRIGKEPKTLDNEVNPNYSKAKLGLGTAVMMELEAGHAPILHAHARMLNHICFPMPDPNVDIDDVSLLFSFSEWQAHMGDTCDEIRKAFDPRGENGSHISKQEAARIEEKGLHHISKFLEFLELLQEQAR
ncbi:MAG: hypothetical protein HUJ30_01935 [Gammaproteobacteria bacterium]|nr:hypothetical protein [Gammaproteobacteria bacterium]